MRSNNAGDGRLGQHLVDNSSQIFGVMSELEMFEVRYVWTSGDHGDETSAHRLVVAGQLHGDMEP